MDLIRSNKKLLSIEDEKKCPNCGFNYVKVGKIITCESDDYECWNGRGGLTSIHFECEGCKGFILNYGFHKGMTTEFITKE